ncbi:MerR family transcriptional regulator [Salisaeta longa]|uniref:MerR family transcriptional regulator n=1 Tax=Salisaeta longa TaxID=503170 RepID=UPI0003B778C0|nr:MerR family transcriptional regulator [Salisaeta longa]
MPRIKLRVHTVVAPNNDTSPAHDATEDDTPPAATPPSASADTPPVPSSDSDPSAAEAPILQPAEHPANTFTAHEVSTYIDQPPHVLRYWESQFDVLNPVRDRNGHRYYTEEDVAVIEHIDHLLNEQKYTTAGAQQALAAERERAAREAELRGALQDIRGTLVSLLDAIVDPSPHD